MAELTEKNISNENDGKGLEALKNLQNEQEIRTLFKKKLQKKSQLLIILVVLMQLVEENLQLQESG